MSDGSASVCQRLAGLAARLRCWAEGFYEDLDVELGAVIAVAALAAAAALG